MSWSRLGCLGRFLNADAPSVDASARCGSPAFEPVLAISCSAAPDTTASVEVSGSFTRFGRITLGMRVFSGIKDGI